MDAPSNSYAGSSEPRPLRPSIFQPTSDRRVSGSDQQSQSSTSNHKKSHLRSLHHNSHRQRHRHREHHHEHHNSHRHSSRQHAKAVVQNTLQLQPPTSFGDLLKQAKGSKDSTPLHSRRESVVKVEEDTKAKAVSLEIPPPKPIGRDDVVKEQRRVKLREEELRASLHALSDQSLRTSRRLDDSYYTILERLSQLQHTIDSLQQLSDMTEELYENFDTDTKELAEDIHGQVEGFHNFDVQQDQVTGLETRIKAGKEKADALSARLEEARERIEARAKVEAEWEARTSRRLRVFWGILASIVGLVVISILFQQFRPIHSVRDRKVHLDFASRDRILDAPIPDAAKEAIIGPTTSPAAAAESTQSVEQHSPPPVQPVVELVDDERLRIFDEL